MHTKSIGNGDLDEMMAAFRDDTTLPRTMVVWKKADGLSRERLTLIRSCARLGRAEIVLGLLQFNLDSSLLFEELFLDALRGDKATVSPLVLDTSLAHIVNCYIPKRGGVSSARTCPNPKFIAFGVRLVIVRETSTIVPTCGWKGP